MENTSISAAAFFIKFDRDNRTLMAANGNDFFFRNSF